MDKSKKLPSTSSDVKNTDLSESTMNDYLTCMEKRGIGKGLLHAAEEDVKILKGKGLVVWGLLLPFFMRAGWFKKQGYRKVDRKGIGVLLWKTFSDNMSLLTTSEDYRKKGEEAKISPSGNQKSCHSLLELVSASSNSRRETKI